MSSPAHEEWNDPGDGERFRRLEHSLSRNSLVEEVQLKPGGAIDAARIRLRQSYGTVPESVVREIYDLDLGIRSVKGYKTVGVTPIEIRGAELEQSRRVGE